MRTTKEIRAAARTALFRTPAGARAMSAMLLLALASSIAALLLMQAFQAFGIETLDLLALTEKRRVLALPITTLVFAAFATLFAAFIRAVFSGIQIFGWSTAALRGVRQEVQGLMGAAFAGFKVPFGMFALMFGYALRLFLALLPFVLVFGVLAAVRVIFYQELEEHIVVSLVLTLFSCLAVLLGFVLMFYVVYRYRFIWFLKVEHPEWRASKCFLESARQMNGLKKKALYLDCSYWKPLTLLILIALLGVLPIVPSVVRALCLSFAVPVLGFLVSVYLEFGHALFYLDATAASEQKGRVP